MAQFKRLIYRVRDLEKKYGSHSALKINKLEIHPGTIYSIVGTVGSGKTTLLNLLAGTEKQTSGTLLYEDKPFDKNWLGKIILMEDIFYTSGINLRSSSKTVGDFIASKFGKKKKVIYNLYFSDGNFRSLLTRKLRNISEAEMNFLGMVFASEADPRVLLIDDYGAFLSQDMEREFRKKIVNMNRTLGTTIILSVPSEIYVKHFSSVMIFLNHGHISKIRPGALSGKTRKKSVIKNKRYRKSKQRKKNN